MDHDHQHERHTISDMKPVELLMEQLRQSRIKLVSVAGDTCGSIEHVIVVCQWKPSENRQEENYGSRF